MSRVPVRAAAIQVGEFAFGVAFACTAVGAAYAFSHAVWALLLVAAVIVTASVWVELRYGAKTTGLVVGMLPTALVAAGLLTAVSMVLYRLN